MTLAGHQPKQELKGRDYDYRPNANGHFEPSFGADSQGRSYIQFEDAGRKTCGFECHTLWNAGNEEGLAITMPKFYTFDGDHLGAPDRHVFGWWTGPDGDLMCVRPRRTTNELAEYALSPVSTR